MKLTKKQAASNRKAIVEAAAQMFRKRGVDGVGLNDLMKNAGFTRGGFYNHFESKEALVGEAFALSFDEALRTLAQTLSAAPPGEGEAFLAALTGYLSAPHRDAADGGCPTAAFVIDAARQGEEVQRAYAAGIERYLSLFETQMGAKKGASSKQDGARPRARAIEMLSGMMGALVLSRAVARVAPGLSEEILATGRSRLVRNNAP
ncbi:TetR/AcrR family transcriptional regulator [Stigmatella sp. ncwal1]|uniref:TetR/AcrR family transcriptional regulator n=1 Tax=Stigmatella ashevillensis TaxID=2995309 RepID=A0ABT5D3J2_9BACT|nr:TetR/AcrR family transcriptional regulator [Stigmatella ashevillena]MDC0708235.1 TetR/AcrR family transcriptional regulator [Stigmatella ashevillena]